MTFLSKLLAQSWLLPALFIVLSLLSFLGWYKQGDSLELARALGFALAVPNLLLFPAGNRGESSSSLTRSQVRPFTQAAWWFGAALVVYSLVSSWL
jgi:hypothetical protein